MKEERKKNMQDFLFDDCILPFPLIQMFFDIYRN